MRLARIALSLSFLGPLTALAQAQGESDEELIMAAARGDVHRVRVLFDRPGTDVNAKTTTGVTALMIAAFGGHTETVQMLLAAGAGVNAKRDNGKTADIVKSCGSLL